MKTINYTLVLICLLMAGLSFGQGIDKVIKRPPPLTSCADFEGYNSGWYGEYASTSSDSPSRDNTDFFKAIAEPGDSYILSRLYRRDVDFYEDDCLCFDYKLIDDGVEGTSVEIHPTLIFFNERFPHQSPIQAKFVANVKVTENTGWVRICAPIKFSNGTSLPSNDHGQWTNVSTSQWNALLTDVRAIGFSVDVGGSGSTGATIGIDNVCLKECEIAIVDEDEDEEGAYCCDGENLVMNGNFEAGNVSFGSDYTNDSSVNPGQFDVTNTAAAFGANIKDHSYCAEPTQYATNDQFLLVNGKTQQSGSSVIWETTISGLERGESYKFCANFKNMPQCTFDIIPEIDMAVSGVGSSGFSAISADANDPCDWVSREYNFTATNNTVTLRIILDETGNGDGNDIAIDDIAVSKLIDTDLSITVQHQGNPQEITASINTISTSDDQLPFSDKCDYYWFVAEVDSYSPVVHNPLTLAYGNNVDNSNGSSPWNLTTTFPDYNFNQNTMYIVGMYTPECECYGEGFTYQLTFNNRQMSAEMMSEDQKQQIIDYILNGRPSGEMGTTLNRGDNVGQGLSVYPNPSRGNFNLSIQGDTLKNVEIFSVTGQPVFSQTYAEGKVNDEIDISSLATGIYFIKAQGADGKQYNAKVIKE